MIRDMTIKEREEIMKQNHKQDRLKSLIVPLEGDTSVTDSKNVMKHGLELQNTLQRPLTEVSSEEFMNLGLSYIEYCEKVSQSPTQVGLAMWLGVSHLTLKRWVNSPNFIHWEILQRFINFFHFFAEQKAMDGMLSPLVYFFQAKNYWGMSDQTEIVHKTQPTETIDLSEQQRILHSTPGVVVETDFEEIEEDLETSSGSEDNGDLAADNFVDLDTILCGDLAAEEDLESWSDEDL